MVNKNFTLLWIGKIVSQLGDKFYAIALAWWILQKTNSPFDMGLFLLVSVLPGILLGFFAGALIDRWQRKTVIIVTDIIRGCLVVAIAYLSIVGVLKIWHVFLIGLFLSLATAFFDPAIQAIIPEIVKKEKLTQANGMSQMVSGICTVAGPLLGALTVSVFGLTWVFFANSISYFVSAFLTCFIMINKAYRNHGEKKNILKDMYEGICFIKRQPRITFVLKIIAIAHFFMGSLTVSLPFLANGLKGSGVNNLGYLQLMMGVGSLTGSAFMITNKKASGDEQILVSSIMAMGFCFIAISTSQFLRIQTVYIYILIMMMIGVCIASAAVFWQSLLQSYTPDHMAGRVFSASILVGNISLPVAYGIFGVLLSLCSIHILMAVCGACLIGLCTYYIR